MSEHVRVQGPQNPPFAQYIENESRFVEAHRSELFDPITGVPTTLFLEMKRRVQAAGFRVVPARVWRRRWTDVYAEVQAELAAASATDVTGVSV